MLRRMIARGSAAAGLDTRKATREKIEKAVEIIAGRRCAGGAYARGACFHGQFVREYLMHVTVRFSAVDNACAMTVLTDY